MFKLKKILNSPTTVPELVYRKVVSGEPFTRGFLLIPSADGKLRNVFAGENPTHVCCEDLAADERDEVLCYEILDTMIFAAPAFSDMSGVPNGAMVALEASENYATSVTPNCTDGCVTLHDAQGARDSGDEVLIRFTK